MNKKTWLLTLVLCLLAALAAVAVRRCPRTVPLDQCSEVYRRYHDLPGIQASFIRNKHINDTLQLDMTLFVADDSLSFANLLKAWNKSDEYITDMMSVDVDENTRFVKLSPIGHPELPKDRSVITNNEIIATFPVRRTIAVFHPKNENDFKTTKQLNFLNKINIF